MELWFSKKALLYARRPCRSSSRTRLITGMDEHKSMDGVEQFAGLQIPTMIVGLEQLAGR